MPGRFRSGGRLRQHFRVVRDADGARIPGAKRYCSNESKGISRELVSNEAGAFTAPGHRSSDWIFRHSQLAVFPDWSAKSIDLQVGRDISLNVDSKWPGTVSEGTVIDETPLVEIDKSGVFPGRQQRSDPGTTD